MTAYFKDMISNVTIGADPEVFLKDRKTSKFVSSIGLIGGTKAKPIFFGDIGIQEDNVLAEFNIPPVSTRADFIKFIEEGKNTINGIIPQHLCVDITPYAFFEDDQLDSPQAKIAGCTPDFNAWTLAQNEPPDLSGQLLRTASGHIHIGYKNPTTDASQRLAKAADLFAAVPSVLMSDETPRRELYGKMGCVRFKDFGVEYRTLSNFWLKTPALIGWAYDAIQSAIEFVNEGNTITAGMERAMTYAINLGSRQAAEFLVKEYNLKVA